MVCCAVLEFESGFTWFFDSSPGGVQSEVYLLQHELKSEEPKKLRVESVQKETPTARCTITQ